MSWFRAATRQPLVYFVLLGAALFVVDAALRRSTNEVVVSPAVRDEVTTQLEQTLKRPPSDEELQRELELWVDAELLFREAEALGLAQNDGVIRAHLARKLEFVVRERTIAPVPSEAELRARFDADRARYQTVDTFDVAHVFLLKRSSPEEQQRRVDEALAQLASGAPLRSVGDHFPRGPVFARLSRLQLEQAIGAPLAALLEPDRLHQWQTVTSPRGTHLLRLDAVHSGAPNFEAARAALTADLQEEQKERAVREFTRELRKKYRVVGLSP